MSPRKTDKTKKANKVRHDPASRMLRFLKDKVSTKYLHCIRKNILSLIIICTYVWHTHLLFSPQSINRLERLGSITFVLHKLDPNEGTVWVVVHPTSSTKKEYLYESDAQKHQPDPDEETDSDTILVLTVAESRFHAWVTSNRENANTSTGKILNRSVEDYDFESFLALAEYREYIKQVSQELRVNAKWCIVHARFGNGKIKNKRGRPEKMLEELRRITGKEE